MGGGDIVPPVGIDAWFEDRRSSVVKDVCKERVSGGVVEWAFGR